MQPQCLQEVSDAPEEHPAAPESEAAFSLWGVANALAESVRQTTADITARYIWRLSYAPFYIVDGHFSDCRL